jgi:hypothetical protein
MMLDVHSSVWRDIYEGIRRDFYHNRAGMTRNDMEAHLRTLGILVRKDSDGHWEWIDVLNPEHFMELYLRWAD